MQAVPTIQETSPNSGHRDEDIVEPNADASPRSEVVGMADRSADWSADWTWPPYAPVPPAEDPRFRLDEWAPASTVRRPWVRLGRWTLLYRRAA